MLLNKYSLESIANLMNGITMIEDIASDALV